MTKATETLDGINHKSLCMWKKQVVEFLEELGVERSDMGGMLRRSPELFASNVKLTLQRKVEFLQNLGVRKEHVWRVLRAYPEMLSLSVEDALQPRLVPSLFPSMKCNMQNSRHGFWKQ